METVEQFARVMLTAELLGGAHLLRRADVQKLIAASPRHRASYLRESIMLPLTTSSARDQLAATGK